MKYYVYTYKQSVLNFITDKHSDTYSMYTNANDAFNIKLAKLKNEKDNYVIRLLVDFEDNSNPLVLKEYKNGQTAINYENIKKISVITNGFERIYSNFVDALQNFELNSENNTVAIISWDNGTYKKFSHVAS